MTSLTHPSRYVIGVDTHTDTHSAAVIQMPAAAVLAEITVPATPAGYDAVVAFADEYTRPEDRWWSIEGTGSHGAGLTRHLLTAGEVVGEVDRPARSPRRHGAKTDRIDAIRAGREGIARDRIGQPRAGGDRYAMQLLLTARQSAVDAAADAQRELRGHLITAPNVLRERLRNLTTTKLLQAAASLRIAPSWDVETRTAATVLRALARRIRTLTAEAKNHDKDLTALVHATRPDLLELPGVGVIVAATILCAWSHQGRIHSEAAFAMLAGTAPIPASSGKTTRHRLNRSGDRQLNRAMHTIVLTRMRRDPATIAYITRRRAEGKTDREIRRCLKRYITRNIYRTLENGA